MPDQDAPPDSSSPLVIAIDRALARTHAIARSALWASRAGALFMASLLSTMGIELIVEAFLRRAIDTAIPLIFVFPLVIPVLVTSGWWVVELDSSRHAFDVLRSLLARERREGGQSIQLRATGALLEVVMADAGASPGACDVATASAVLIPLLQSIRPEDSLTLTRAQRDRLYEIVVPGGKEYWTAGSGGVGGRNPSPFLDLCNSLRPAAIHALGTLGDATSIPLLEKFIKKTGDPTLRAIAIHSLEQIRERSRCGPEQMLRAVDRPVHPETLLRVVASGRTPQSDPQQLLCVDNASPGSGNKNNDPST